jgi:hypothetical protein
LGHLLEGHNLKKKESDLEIANTFSKKLLNRSSLHPPLFLLSSPGNLSLNFRDGCGVRKVRIKSEYKTESNEPKAAISHTQTMKLKKRRDDVDWVVGWVVVVQLRFFILFFTFYKHLWNFK